ncbi:MAG TPA: diaminopimelate epimerase [Micromonosporaceae bacterium]
MQFSKGHGTGNDFVILPDPDGRLQLAPTLVAALCDRRRGIGADGVLRVVRAARDPESAGAADSAEWFMDYRNADGSLGDTCGNGLRVFVRYLIDAGLVGPGPAELPVVTRAGVVRARIGTEGISVDLGRPKVGGESTATVAGWRLSGVAVDCGNPHLVCRLPAGVELADLDLTRQPGFDAEDFPAGVNIEFVTAADPIGDADAHLRMRVHERGVGETMSCGSGACAVAAVAVRDAGRADGVVLVDVPGGRLTITLDDASCWLAGPAVLVAHGEVDPEALAA